MDDVRLMPDEHREAARAAEDADGERGRARVVADYVAGMTDRYAILEHGGCSIRRSEPEAER